MSAAISTKDKYYNSFLDYKVLAKRSEESVMMNDFSLFPSLAALIIVNGNIVFTCKLIIAKSLYVKLSFSEAAARVNARDW